LLIQTVIEDTEMGCAPTVMGDPAIVLSSPLSTDAEAVRVLIPSSASGEAEGDDEEEEAEEAEKAEEEAGGSTPDVAVVHATVDVAGSDPVPTPVKLAVPVELAIPAELAIPDEEPDPLTVTAISGESALSSPLES
jgi:hypothetical protein